jgi:predicted PurR-regulated permease PerM
MVLTVIAVLWAAYAAAAFVAPLTLSLFILAVSWPIQSALQSKLPLSVAVVLTVLLIIAVILTLSSITIWAFGTIWQTVGANAARYQILYQAAADWLEERGFIVAGFWADNNSVIWIVRFVQQLAARMGQTMSFCVVVFAYVLTGLVETSAAKKSLEELATRPLARIVLAGCSESARKLRWYLWVRMIMSFITAATITAFALFVGIPFPLEWGIIGFTLNFIPFIGPLIATTSPSLFVVAQLGNGGLALFAFVCLTTIQFLLGSYVEPKISGGALHISPFVILLSIFLWTFLWGIYGAFIGVPIAIVVASFSRAMAGISEPIGESKLAVAKESVISSTGA